MQKTLAIIGGGWAGAAAAVEAIRSGWRVVLFEERPYLGGRARSFVERTTGEVIDNGQHLLMGAYHCTRATLDALGTTHLLRWQHAMQVQFIDAQGTVDVFRTGSLPGKFGIVLGILRMRSVSLRGRLMAVRLAIRLRLQRIPTDGRTCLELLQSERQPPDVITRFWQPIILATLNAPMHVAAASLFCTVLSRAFFGSRDDARLCLPTEGLSALIDPLQGFIERAGGSVHLGSQVRTLNITQQLVRSVTTMQGATVDVDAVVVAVPPRALSRLNYIDDGISSVLTAAVDLEFSPIISVYLWYDKPWLSAEFCALIGTTTQWIFNRRAIAQADASTIEQFPGHVALTVSAGSQIIDMEASEITALCETELRAVFPTLQGVTLLHSLVIKEKQATFTSTPAVEPQRPTAKTAYSNVALAGDWTGTGLPATIEGAAVSGVNAVRCLE